MLVMHPRHAGLVPGKEARQLIRRHQEIDGGNDEQDDAEQGQYQLHGWILLKSTTMERRDWPRPGEIENIVYRHRASGGNGSPDRAQRILHCVVERRGMTRSAEPGAAAALAF